MKFCEYFLRLKGFCRQNNSILYIIANNSYGIYREGMHVL